jgi:hypothetical protein
LIPFDTRAFIEKNNSYNVSSRASCQILFDQIMATLGQAGINWVWDRRDNWHAYSLFCRDIIVGDIDELALDDLTRGMEVYSNIRWLSEQF